MSVGASMCFHPRLSQPLRNRFRADPVDDGGALGSISGLRRQFLEVLQFRLGARGTSLVGGHAGWAGQVFQDSRAR